jgi:glycosyltransferase involved in cell wall biosynthesis
MNVKPNSKYEVPVKVAVIVPCYNEQEILNYSAEKLQDYILGLIGKGLLDKESYICFVDDGSRDKTWELIQNLVKNGNHFKGIKLSANFGHQNALIAGMFSEKKNADCLITIDADMQDDIRVIDQMVLNYLAGSKVVYGVRDNRDNDTFFKKFTAQTFYKLMNAMKVKTVYNHADYRLLASEVVEHLERFEEVSLFLRGIIPLIGFQSSSVYYKRDIRIAGESKYPFRKMLNFAWNGITSFSTAPLRVIFYVGVFMFVTSFILGLWVIISLLNGSTIQGWASSLLLNLAFSGINMICLGIIGEYIGKIYQEVKSRPRFIIEERIENGN